LRQYGRILMGIAFILISLRFLREAMDPIRESAFLPALSAYLARDYLTAFIVGATLAFVMHSSVASILMFVTLVAIGAIPLAAGISLVLGANLGSAVIPIWLTRGMPALARRVPFANLVLRGSWALLILFAVNLLQVRGILTSFAPAQMLIFTHIAFNLTLLMISLPFVGVFSVVAEKLLPQSANTSGDDPDAPISALDHSALDNPTLALASLKRELLRMSAIVETMATPVIEVYGSGDTTRITSLRRLDSQVNSALKGIKITSPHWPQTAWRGPTGAAPAKWPSSPSTWRLPAISSPSACCHWPARRPRRD
jgi:phosphate:Na+ symporter